MGARRTERWAASLGAWRPGDVAAARRRYQDIRRARTEDPRVRAPDSDVSADNPLAHSADSGWGNYFKTAEVRDTIALDLERLHPGDAFYSAPDVQHALLNVLLVWSLENPRLGYRQGMHELASLVFSQRASDAMASDPSGHRWGASTSAPASAPEQNAPGPHEPELSASYVEHDAYAMFAALMGADSPPNGRGKIRLASFFEDPEGPGKLSGVQMACDRVYVRLQKVDPALRTHLDKVGIEPQLFLLRWLRVLFSREFHLDDAMLIWDAAIGTNDPSDGDDTSFSMDGDIDYDNPGVMDFIESTAVAMLVFVRVDVLSSGDFGSCLRRLQKFPPVEDVLALVERARFASRGKVDADGWIPRAVSSSQTPGGASTPSSSGGHTVSGHKQTPGSKANEFLAKAKETGGVAREKASALIGRAKNAMGVLKLEDDQGGLRYDIGAGEPFGSSAQPELPGVSGELPGVDLGAVDASRPLPPVRPIATTPPTAIPRRLSEDIRGDTSPRSATASPTHHLMRPRSTAPGEDGPPAEEGDELRYGEMKSPARPVFDAPATGYEEILPRDPTPSPGVPPPPPAPAVSALSVSGLIDPSPDNRGEALFGTSGGEKNAVKKPGGLFDDDDPSTTGGLFDPSPPRHLSGGSMGGSLSGRAVGMVSKVRSLFADGDEDEDPLFGGGLGRGRRELTPNEGVSLGQQSSSHSALVALKDAAGAIEGVLSRGEVSDEAAAGDLREALVKLRSATARLR
jgi:hypothetical protein